MEVGEHEHCKPPQQEYRTVGDMLAKLLRHYHHPRVAQACARLGVSAAALKRCYRRLGSTEYPNRAHSSTAAASGHAPNASWELLPCSPGLPATPRPSALNATVPLSSVSGMRVPPTEQKPALPPPPPLPPPQQQQQQVSGSSLGAAPMPQKDGGRRRNHQQQSMRSVRQLHEAEPSRLDALLSAAATAEAQEQLGYGGPHGPASEGRGAASSGADSSAASSGVASDTRVTAHDPASALPQREQYCQPQQQQQQEPLACMGPGSPAWQLWQHLQTHHCGAAGAVQLEGPHPQQPPLQLPPHQQGQPRASLQQLQVQHQQRQQPQHQPGDLSWQLYQQQPGWGDGQSSPAASTGSEGAGFSGPGAGGHARWQQQPQQQPLPFPVPQGWPAATGPTHWKATAVEPGWEADQLNPARAVEQSLASGHSLAPYIEGLPIARLPSNASARQRPAPGPTPSPHELARRILGQLRPQ